MEIWHNYSTYLSVQKIDLESAAKILVESEVAVCAMLRDGRTFWGRLKTGGESD